MKRKNILLVLMIAIMAMGAPLSGWGQSTLTIPSSGITGATYSTTGTDSSNGSSDQGKGSPMANTYREYSVTQFLYTSTEMGDAKTLKSISFYHNAISFSSDIYIYLKETDDADTYNYTASTSSGATLVYSATNATIGASSAGWQTFSFDADFNYSGTKNLLVIVVRGGNTAHGWTQNQAWYYTTTSFYSFRFKYSDTQSNVDLSSTSGYTSNCLQRPVVQFTYIPTYTVTYNANGGSGTMTDPNSPYASGSSVTVLSNAFTAPSGMTFSGWNTAANGSGTSYAPGDHFNISANTTLYAQWTASGGGTTVWAETTTIVPGEDYLIGFSYNGNVYLAVNYCTSESNHYYTSVSMNYYGYTALAAIDGNGHVTGVSGYATDLQYCTWKFSTSTGGTITSGYESGRYLYGYTSSNYADLYPNTSSQSWTYSSGTLSNGSYKADYYYVSDGHHMRVTSSPSATVKLYTQQTVYTVTYDANGGTGTMTDPNSPYVSGSTVTVLANTFTAPSGTTFSGWNTASDGSGTSYAAGATFSISANTTLYAQWASSASCEAIGENSTSNGTSSSNAGYTPINLYYNYSYNQMVYDGSSMPTTINSISFKYKSTYAVTQKTDVDIYLGETTSTTLTSYMSASDLTKVYSGAMDFPANSDGWVEFTFNENGGSFSHDQSKNIVVVVNDKSGAYPTSNYSSMYFYYLTGSSGVHMYSRNDSSGAYSVPPSSGTASTYLPVVRFCGSSVVTIPTHTITATADPTTGGTVSFMTGPANSTTARTHLPLDSYRNYSFSQQIYTPDEVGGGTISSISLYSVDGNLNDGVDFTRTLAVYMAHTDKTEFSSTSDWISNSDSPDMALVYSGNVTFDCGEWNTINFTNSFNYDGTRNLVLIIADNTGTSAPAGNYLECKTFTPSSGGYCSLNHDTQFNPSSPSGNGERLTEKNQILINPGSSDSRDFPEGASCTLVATPNDGYRFVNWTENNSTVGNSTTYTISNIQADHDLVAHFERDSYTLTTSANPSAGGTVSPSGNNTYTPGASVTLTATANTGYTFSGWTVDNVSDGNTNPRTITMNADHIVVANFTQNDYTITYSPSSSNPSNGCYISGNTSAHYGDNIMVTLNVATGYELRSITATDGNTNTVTLTGNGITDGSTYTFSMPASNVTVTAEFKRACMVPTNLAESTTINSATITWDDSYGSEWQVAHATSSSANPDNNIISPNVTEQTYTMGNLTLGSTHYFWVRSYCSVSEQSAWVGPVEVVIECTAPGNTLSATATSTGAVLTWDGGTGEEYIVELGTVTTTTGTIEIMNEGFEEGITGWTSSNSSVSWTRGTKGYYTSRISSAYEGDYLAYPNVGSSGNSSNTGYFISPVMDLSGYTNVKLTCWYINPAYNNSYSDTFGIYYRTSSSGSWTSLFSTSAGHASWTQTSQLTLPSQSYVQLGFYFADGNGYGVAIDDILIEGTGTISTTSWSSIATDATSPYTITGCNIGATYKARVKDQCNTSSSTSNEVEFTPACNVPTNLTVNNITLNSAVASWDGEAESYNVRYRTVTPHIDSEVATFFENFDSGSLPSGWATYAQDYSSTSTNWRVYSYTNSHSGNYVAFSRSYDGSTDRSVDNWLVTPQITFGDSLKFWMRDDGTWHDYIAVYVSTDGNNFTRIKEPGEASATWTEVTVDLSSYSGQQGYIAIRHLDEGNNYIAIDDFGIYTYTISYTYGAWQDATPDGNSAVLSGLTSETLYEVQVQADCTSGNVTSEWTSSVSFETLPACTAPVNLNATDITASTATLSWSDYQDSYNVRYRGKVFLEDFDAGIPSTWTTTDSDGDEYNWGDLNNFGINNTDCASSASYINDVGALTPDNWLISPQLDLQGFFEVWLKGQDADDFEEHYAIYLSTTGNAISNFTSGTLLAEGNTTNSYQRVTANLSSYAEQQGWIAIRHYNCTDQYWFCVDNFGIYTSDWLTTTANDPTTSVNNLLPNTEYEWQVQGVHCSGNNNTDWSDYAFFTTLNGYTITAVADPAGGGTFTFSGDIITSSSTNPAVVSPNGDVTVSATATAGYTFMNWIEGGSVVSTTNDYALTGVNASHDLIAHFVDMTASNTWPAAVTTLAAATPGYSVDGSTITISNANGLAWLISTVNGLNSQSGNDITSSTVINLTADVDMSAHIWVPIGTTEHPFVGTFNGNGHTISGINRALEFPNQGVFGYVSGGTIHDVVVNTNITGDCNYMGSVAGTLASGTVYNTGSTGTVTANANTIAVGGTVGYNGGLVHSSFATGTFTGLAGDYVGGLVGENATAGRLYNSYSNATLTGGNRGGLVGYNKGIAANCYNVNNSATYAYANINAGTMEYVYSDNTNNGYYQTIEGSATLQHHGSSFSAVQSDIKHLDYMYRDNAITLVTGQTNSYVPSSVSYDNNHTVKWNGLVSALNQWVEANKTSGANISDLSSWYRPLTTNINGDLPVLGFNGETTLGAANGSPKALKYGTMDYMLTTYNNSTASIFHYGKATEVSETPGENVHVYIDENAVLLQAASSSAFSNTTVGVTFDNSDHGTHAYDYWGNKLDYDWHFLSTPLSNAKIGATYNDYNAHGYGSGIDIKSLVNSYFPNGLPMTLHDENWRWDFYTYYEPEYHWINMKRNKNNHYHVDGGGSISYTYVADDQAVGDEASLACVFTPGKGYMLAISKDVFMNSTGTLNRGDVPIRLTLKEPDDINYASGWNLVGNPYQAYLNINSLNRNLYIYDADQGVYAPYAPAASGNPATPSQYIHPHQAFFVHAASDGEELTFTQAMASTETTPYSYYRDDRIDYPLVNLYAENNAGQRDLTVVEFHRPELGGARKLETMRNAPFTIAAHYAGMSYGILFATDDIERIPVRFKTDESGWVTLTWSTHNGVFSKLLLIDNKLGVEHNMLADNSYTFEASPDDYSSRFYIVYDCSGMGIEENEDDGGASTGSATFAYINNGNIVIDVDTGHGASIQVIDVLGRVLYSKTIAGTEGTSCTVSTKGLAKGVYLIRLADGHNVKTQKLVVQ